MSNRNFVNLNINPCKMCMPLGAAIAFKGLENAMFMLHGSQGCSTYIRRHMAGHYNEPIDIGSSSLNEEGTVYGGESNLKKGLKNLIKLYHPEIIGVATTCLAETIGEDIKRIIAEFVEEEGFENVKIVPVSTPGYGGTQFEGYYSAVKSIVKYISKDDEKNGNINIIAGNLNPGDIREIKRILNSFEVDYILLPDISETLDAPYKQDYKRIPEGGTRLQGIEKMAGAAATVEMGVTLPSEISPGQYLMDTFGVPLYKCPLPIGVQNTDAFLKIISEITGKPVPSGIEKERGRLIDGMIDSHKFNSEGRAVIYGEPELVCALSQVCFENGIQPVLICSGTQNSFLKSLLENNGLEEKPLILDDIDFETIQKYAKELHANIIIGNSDGKVITEKEGIPLLRIGFPIHDRVGGQRQVYTGYNGTMKLLDDITNTLLEKKHEKYRTNMYRKYYKEIKSGDAKGTREANMNITVEERTRAHPCYSEGACKNARMHIPVAPYCNISCNYCNRKYDCVNESRPGVTSEVLTPEAALEKFLWVKKKLKNLKVVGIAGPGDVLANFENTKKSVELIKEVDPDITFCLSTNGLMLPYYADEIAALGVTHVTVTINTIDPKIGAQIYRYIHFMGTKLEGEKAAALLIANQLLGLKLLVSKGVVCKVNIVMMKGINDSHIEEVVRTVKECGAFMTNIMPLIPAKGSAFENMPLTNNRELNELRKKCNIELKQMYHCKQCRADAIGLLEQDCSSEFRNFQGCGSPPDEDRGEGENHFFAVATKTGMLVDQHFGHVDEFYIYQYNNSRVQFVEKRQVNKYCSGTEDCESEESKIDKIIRTVENCDAILVLRIGHQPAKVLEERNIKVIQTYGKIEECIKNVVDQIYKRGVDLDAKAEISCFCLHEFES